jgi:CRP/FNR family transcriptional regulator
MSDEARLLLAALEQQGWPVGAAHDLASKAHIVEYQKRALIFRAGEPADLVYFLLRGQVKLLYEANAGSRLLVGFSAAGEMLGHVSPQVSGSADRDLRQLFTAETLSPGKIAILSFARLSQACNQLSSGEVIQVLNHLADTWKSLSCRLLALLSMSIRERLTYCIEEIARRFGTVDTHGTLIELRLSHEELADLVGASRPIVSKHLKRLTHEGVLSKHGGRYLLRSGNAAGSAWSTVSVPDHQGTNDRELAIAECAKESKGQGGTWRTD